MLKVCTACLLDTFRYINWNKKVKKRKLSGTGFCKRNLIPLVIIIAGWAIGWGQIFFEPELWFIVAYVIQKNTTKLPLVPLNFIETSPGIWMQRNHINLGNKLSDLSSYWDADLESSWTCLYLSCGVRLGTSRIYNLFDFIWGTSMN